MAIGGWSTDIRGPECTYSLMPMQSCTTLFGDPSPQSIKVPITTNTTTNIQIIVLSSHISDVFYVRVCQKHVLLTKFGIVISLAVTGFHITLHSRWQCYMVVLIVMQQGRMQRHLVGHVWIFGSAQVGRVGPSRVRGGAKGHHGLQQCNIGRYFLPQTLGTSELSKLDEFSANLLSVNSVLSVMSILSALSVLSVLFALSGIAL